MGNYTLTYVDHRPIWIPKLKNHAGGVNLPRKSGDNKINVTETERKHLLKMKNGNRPCFVEEQPRQVRIRQTTDGGAE